MRRSGLSRLSLCIASVALTALVTAACGNPRPSVPQGLGTVLPPGHEVPSTPLVNQDGQTVTLQSFHGKYVVLAQFLTLCQDECPITTAAFQIMRRSVQKAGLGSKVAFIEATVDPDRDTVARLRAYQERFGADWTLLTGTDSDIAALWKYFGIFYQKVPEDYPDARDWLTGQPLSYDMEHSNGFILIDPDGNERFITTSLPFLHGEIPEQLRGLLDQLGIQHLKQGIAGNSYTIPQAMSALSWLVGREIPLVTS
jgi:protein SCO1/2